MRPKSRVVGCWCVLLLTLGAVSRLVTWANPLGSNEGTPRRQVDRVAPLPLNVGASVPFGIAHPLSGKVKKPPRRSTPFSDTDTATDNWDLINSGLSPEDIAPFLANGQPESIVYFGRDAITQIYPLRSMPANDTTQTLFVGDAHFVKKTARERKERAKVREETEAIGQPGDQALQLPENAFEIVFFHPGKRDNGDVLRAVAEDLILAIQGPDYSHASVDANDSSQMKALLSSLLSFGHAGELLLKVKDGGFIVDEPGFDFSLYENAFRIGRTRKIFQEFGLVGVSEVSEPTTFHWFECDPRNGVVRGCFGAVPTDEGGDQFDLAEVGQKKIKYIWIKDLGINKNFPSKWPTEGCDLDALRLFHAYRDE